MVRLALLLSLVCLTGIALGLPTNDDLEIDLEHHHDHSHHDDTSDSSEEDHHHTVDSSDESHDHDHHHHHLSQGIDLTNGTCLEKAERLLHYLWQRYKARFGIKCSQEKERKWKGFFKLALEKIQLHNMEADMGLHSHHEGLNPLSCLSPDEMKARNGFKQNPNRNRNSEDEFTASLPLSALPSSYDSREHGIVTPVKDQGQCGSCYTFASTGALEVSTLKATQQTIILSEQDLVDCTTSVGNYGCNGGFPDETLKHVQRKGVNSEKSYPYKARQGQCKHSENALQPIKIKEVKNVKPNSDEALMEAVMTYGSAAAAMDADDIQNYKSGVFKCTKKPKLNHAVLVVGYTDKYWIVKNSWSCKWGNNGYIHLARGKTVDCGITEDACVVGAAAAA